MHNIDIANRFTEFIEGMFGSQRKAADFLNVAEQSISNIAKGRAAFGGKWQNRLRGLGADVEYILTGKKIVVAEDSESPKPINQNKVEFINFQIPKDAVMIPEYGSPVHAGNPALAYNDLVGMVNATRHLHAQSYYVRVKGRSMEGRNIKEGQRLLVDGSLEPRNGNLVVAWVNSEYTVKVFKENGGQWLLNPDPDPENPEEFNPIRYDDTDGKKNWASHQR